MNITIRRMQEEDMGAVIEILTQWNMAPIEPSAEIPNPERSSVSVENSFVALDGERIIGVCSYVIHSPEIAETASLAVNPDYRGKGVGYRLQVARLKALKERGIKILKTETSRPSTIEWYIRKFGYRVVGRRKKRHAFAYPSDYKTILELDLEDYPTG